MLLGRKGAYHSIIGRMMSPPVSNPTLFTFPQRLKSWRNGLSLGIADALSWSPGTYRERPALGLAFNTAAAHRAAELTERYGVQFERQLSARTSIANYEYLDLLDRMFDAAGLSPAARRGSGISVHDVGSASFWYAPCLHAFFKPTRLIGFELEGSRRFWNGRTRRDYAAGYITALPGAEYRVIDYRQCRETAQVITAWYPFLFAEPLLAWGLRLSDFNPGELFGRMVANLAADGMLVMVNQGGEEQAAAEILCLRHGLSLLRRFEYDRSLFRDRKVMPVATCWRREKQSC